MRLGKGMKKRMKKGGAWWSSWLGSSDCVFFARQVAVDNGK